MKFRTVSIIGAGPAGIAASIQLRRSGVEFFLFERSKIGGLIINGCLIENYPGIPGGIRGDRFAALLDNQLKSFDINPVFSNVEELYFVKEKNVFRILTDKNEYFSDYIIAATGTNPDIPEIMSGSKSNVRKKLYSDISILREVRNSSILIIGGGDAAFDYALSLSGSNSVTIAYRNSKYKALDLLVERAMKSEKISLKTRTKLESIVIGVNNNLEAVLKINEKKIMKEFDLMVFAIGRHPANELFKNIIRKGSGFSFDKERIILAGDVKNGNFRQAVIAAGEGLYAAMKIVKMKNGDLNGSFI